MIDILKTHQLSISRFLRVLERDGIVALTHQLRPEPVYLLEKVWRQLAYQLVNATLPKDLGDLVQELATRNILIDSRDVDVQELKMARDKTLQSLNRPTILYLMMAQHCNFACTYCPIPNLAKLYGERLLSFEDAIAGIKLWQRHIEEYIQDDDPYFLIFYGGEPLLNREIMERLLIYIAKERSMGRFPNKLELMLCTNGSLIDEHLSRLLADHKITVAIGVDGPQQHNDRIRITNGNGPTFSVIRSAIKRLIDNGVRVVASVTITPANIHVLHEYHEFFRKMDIAQFGFNLMKGKFLLHDLANKSAEDYCRLAAQGILSGSVDALENGHAYEYQLEKKLVALRTGLPFSTDCTCYGNQLVIQADGQVSNCPFLRLDQGHIGTLSETFRIGQTEAVRKWRHRLPILNDSITTGSNNSVLDGGGCAWSSSELYGDAMARDTHNAIFTKEIAHELIWTLLPREQKDALHRGGTRYWSYRRIGTLHDTGASSL